jgi:hypothetical protein
MQHLYGEHAGAVVIEDLMGCCGFECFEERWIDVIPVAGDNPLKGDRYRRVPLHVNKVAVAEKSSRDSSIVDE